MGLGERLRSAREERGLRGYQLEEMIGTKGGSVSRWENNERRPRSEHVRRLAEVLGVRIEWLLTGEPPKEPTASALSPVLLGAPALDHVLATYVYPLELSIKAVDSIEEIVRAEVAANPKRSPAAWRHRLDAMCADHLEDSRPRAKAR